MSDKNRITHNDPEFGSMLRIVAKTPGIKKIDWAGSEWTVVRDSKSIEFVRIPGSHVEKLSM